MTEHATDRWTVRDRLPSGPQYDNHAKPRFVLDRNGYTVAEVWGNAKCHRDVNAQRIVDCINACAGINPEAVPELLKAIKEATWALRDVACLGPDEAVNPEWYPIVHRCEAVIAKAQPQKETTQ